MVANTSAEEKGQIFIPQINWILFAVTASIVLGFKNRVIFLYAGVKNVPHVRAEDRVKFRTFAEGFYLTLVRYGFMDRTDVRAAIRILDKKHLRIELEDTTFFVESDTLLPSRSIGMSPWRDKIYLLMWRNSERATTYFNLPPDRVLEIGMQIKF